MYFSFCVENFSGFSLFIYFHISLLFTLRLSAGKISDHLTLPPVIRKQCAGQSVMLVTYQVDEYPI